MKKTDFWTEAADAMELTVEGERLITQAIVQNGARSSVSFRTCAGRYAERREPPSAADLIRPVEQSPSATAGTTPWRQRVRSTRRAE